MYLCCGYGLCLFLRFINWILERFRRVLRFPPPIKHSHVITELLLKVTLNTINWQCNTLLLFIGLRVWYIWLVFNPKKDIKGKDKLQFYSLVNLLINIILYICTCGLYCTNYNIQYAITSQASLSMWYHFENINSCDTNH
jgi:hypothetical protein